MFLGALDHLGQRFLFVEQFSLEVLQGALIHSCLPPFRMLPVLDGTISGRNRRDRFRLLSVRTFGAIFCLLNKCLSGNSCAPGQQELDGGVSFGSGRR